MNLQQQKLNLGPPSFCQFYYLLTASASTNWVVRMYLQFLCLRPSVREV